MKNEYTSNHRILGLQKRVGRYENERQSTVVDHHVGFHHTGGEIRNLEDAPRLVTNSRTRVRPGCLQRTLLGGRLMRA